MKPHTADLPATRTGPLPETGSARRWYAGGDHWHPGPCVELTLEHDTTAWVVTYLDHGEVHARIGFDTEREARGELGWIMRNVLAEYRLWRAG